MLCHKQNGAPYYIEREQYLDATDAACTTFYSNDDDIFKHTAQLIYLKIFCKSNTFFDEFSRGSTHLFLTY